MPSKRYDELDEFTTARCRAKLEQRGFHRDADGMSEISLSARFAGWVGLPTVELAGGRDAVAVLVSPKVAVRDNEARLLVAELTPSPAEGVLPRQNIVVSEDLCSLIPERAAQAPEWTATNEEDAEAVSRYITEDIVFAGFPFMQRLASPDSFFEAFSRAPRRILWPRESAVTYMLNGDLSSATKMLMRLARPLSHNPTIWADKDAEAVNFFETFATHFCVDLRFDEWPVRKRSRPNEISIKIRDRGVIPAALRLVGRPDLAESGSGLNEEAIDRIGKRAAEIYTTSDDKNPDRAVGLAAIEFLTAPPRLPTGTTPTGT